MTPCRRGLSSCGFSLVELLIALTVCAIVSAALAGLVPPARAAFEATPEALDLQQRGRTGIDVLVTAIRSAVILETTLDGGEFESLYAVVPVPHPSQGTLETDQPGPQGPLTLAPGPGCPAIAAVCGFTPGSVAAILDGSGRFDVFIVTSVDAARMQLVASRPFASAYRAGSSVFEVDAHLFRLDGQPDGSRALVRETAGGAIQPIVDNVAGLGIHMWPTVRQIDIWMRVEAAPPALRGSVPDRTLHASISPRNHLLGTMP